MNLHLTIPQYRALLAALHIATGVTGPTNDDLPHEEATLADDIDELESFVLQQAVEAGCPDLVKKSKGEYVFNDCEPYHDILEKFEDIVFWDQLEMRLAERDFFRDATPTEIFAIEQGEAYPMRMCELRTKYNIEIDEHGVDRIEIRGEPPSDAPFADS